MRRCNHAVNRVIHDPSALELLMDVCGLAALGWPVTMSGDEGAAKLVNIHFNAGPQWLAIYEDVWMTTTI